MYSLYSADGALTGRYQSLAECYKAALEMLYKDGFYEIRRNGKLVRRTNWNK